MQIICVFIIRVFAFRYALPAKPFVIFCLAHCAHDVSCKVFYWVTDVVFFKYLVSFWRQRTFLRKVLRWPTISNRVANMAFLYAGSPISAFYLRIYIKHVIVELLVYIFHTRKNVFYFCFYFVFASICCVFVSSFAS